MDTGPAPRWRLRALALLAFGAMAAPAFAATCTVEAQVAPASLDIPDFVSVSGTLVPNAKQLNASPSKPDPRDGGTYAWTVLSGPAGYALTGANTPKPVFTPADVGPAGATYILRLRVGGCGSSASLDYSIRVTDANAVVVNAAPHAVASATPNPALEGDSVLLDGSASSDPDNDALSYAWEQTGGPALTLTGANSAQAGFIAPNVAATTSYQFRLTVSDGSLSDAATVDVNVAWTNDPPVAQLSCPLEVDEGQSVTLDGSASSDSDDGIASYAWVQKSGDPVVAGVPTWSTGSPTFAAPALGFRQTGLVGFVLTVRDHSGAVASADCDLMIRDVTAPLVTGSDILADADNASGAVVDFVPAPSAFDAVDGDVSHALACTPASGSSFAMGDTTVSCSATDSAGNTGTGGFTVTVADLSPPTIAAHGDYSLEATGPQTPVDYGVPATSDKVDGAGLAACTPPPGLFPVDATPVTCTASDTAGNAAVPVSFTVTVHDTTPPSLALPAAMTLEATSPAGAAAIWTASANDLVDGSVAVSCSAASGATFALGAHVVTCSATDAHLNVATGHFAVTVVDTTPPAMSPDPLPDVTVTATANSAATVDFALPTASDIVDGARAVSCSAQPGASFPVGATTVTCSASDLSGNTVTRSFTVRVNYAFNGFFQPIDMAAINTAKAGSAIPVKFSLGGNQGLAIFAANSPASGAITCDAQASTDEIETTLTAGGSTLQYDATSGQYIYVWKTDRSWLGCRVLKVTLRDGSTRTAVFKFR